MIQKTVLSNGIRVVTEVVPNVHSVSIGIWIKTGSRHEKDGENGIAHFIEHMLFKGTEKHTAFDIAKVIDSVGGILNAFTTKEYTCYYVKVLTQHLSLGIDILWDIFFHSLFQSEEIEKERNVILQEINMVKDTPDDYIQDLFNQSFYSGHSLGNAILGELETVERFGRQDMVDFFAREYLDPGRIIISAAGNIEHDFLADQVLRIFEIPAKAGEAAHKDSFRATRQVSFHYRELEQVHMCLGTVGASQVDPERYGYYLISSILGGSMSSRLFQEIRENRGLAYSVYSFLAAFYDTGMFGVYMGVRRESLKEALHIVLAEFRRLQEEAIAESDLTNAKEQIKGNMLLGLESSDSRMSRLAKCEIYYDEYIPVEELIRNIDAVTPEAVREIARRIFRDELFTYTFLGPVNKKEIQDNFLAMG